MRKHLVTLGIVVLVLGALVSSACKFGTGNNNNNASGSPSSSTPKNSGSATPTESFKTFYNALKNKDAAALKTVLPKKVLDGIVDEAKKKNKPLDDYYRDEVIPQISRDLPASMPETRNEKIEGDRATLEFQENGNWETNHFSKEGDSWKIDT